MKSCHLLLIVNKKMILKSDEFSNHIFKHVLPRDMLPPSVNYPSAYVVNTQGKKHPGEHWLAYYYNEDGNCDFFDSFGFSPILYGLTDFLDKTSIKWKYNENQIQSLTSEFCGYYCVYFILLRSRNIPLETILKLFDTKHFFKNDLRIKHLLI